MARKKREQTDEETLSAGSEPSPGPVPPSEPAPSPGPVPSPGPAEEEEEDEPEARDANAEMLSGSVVAPVTTRRHSSAALLARDPETFVAKPESPDRGE